MGKKIVLSFCMSLTAALFMSCATSVAAKVMRPAELDLQGAETIAVLPFSESYRSTYYNSGRLNALELISSKSRGSDQDSKTKQAVCDYISNALEEGLAGQSFYNLQNSTLVRMNLEQGKPSPADLYITGYISQYRDDLTVDESDDADKSTACQRDVNMTIVYQIVDAETGTVVHRDSEMFSERDSQSTVDELKTATELLKGSLDSFVDGLLKKIQPYEEKVYYTLMADKTKNPDMKEAEKLAKKGFVSEAEEMFSRIYEDTGNPAAGYNAAILLEAQGDLYAARDLMEKVFQQTEDKKAKKALDNINSEIESAKRLNNQTAGRGVN